MSTQAGVVCTDHYKDTEVHRVHVGVREVASTREVLLDVGLMWQVGRHLPTPLRVQRSSNSKKPPFFFQLHPSTNVTAALTLGTRAEPSARAVASRGTLDEVSILTRDIMPRWFLFAGFLFRRVVL